MSAVPTSFDGALALRHRLDAQHKQREEREAFLRLLADLVRRYVRFWHVQICEKSEEDLRNYSPELTPRQVQPSTAHSFFATPFVTSIYEAKNRARGGPMLPRAGGDLWMDKPVQDSRTEPIQSQIGGPFPLILHKVGPPRSAEKSYAAWEAGELSSSRRPWEIDSNAVGHDEGVRLRGKLDRVSWHYDLGTAFDFEHAANPSLGRERVLQQAPKFARSHTLTIVREGQVAHVEIIFDHPPNHVQARREGEAYRVLGKSSARRRH